MDNPEDDDDDNLHQDEWVGLDQSEFRLKLRRVFRKLSQGDFESSDQLHKQMSVARRIFDEEMAEVMRDHVTWLYKQLSGRSLEDSKGCVSEMNQCLDAIGLSVQHPNQSGLSMRFGVAATPPKEGESWVVLVPIQRQHQSDQYRLPYPIEGKLNLIQRNQIPHPLPPKGRELS